MKNLIPAIVLATIPPENSMVNIHIKFTPDGQKVLYPTAHKPNMVVTFNAQRSPHNGDNNRHQVSLS